jgi:hypothetical protein
VAFSLSSARADWAFAIWALEIDVLAGVHCFAQAESTWSVPGTSHERRMVDLAYQL